MENNNIQKEYLDDPSMYFTQDEWKKLERYEKIRIQNVYEIYVEMINSGFNMEKPDFMTRVKEQPKVDKNKTSKRKNTEISEQNAKSKKIGDKGKSASKVRYPKRNVPKKNYTEEKIVPDDRYIYCDICLNEFVDKCSIHFSIFLSDEPVPLTPKNPNRARETVPKDWLVVSSSKIQNGGEGVWALKKLKMGIRFGPYEGTSEKEETDGQYSWQIKKEGRVVRYINGEDTSKANWMRYVNCARFKNEQNLMAYQYCGKIYYRTVAEINPGTELLVYYGPQFARELGIDTKKYNSPPEQPLNDNVFECTTCHLAFSCPMYLDSHTPRCRDKKCTTLVRTIQENSHDESASSNNNASFACHLCDKIYTVKVLFRYHLMVKHCIYENPGPKSNQESGTASNAESNSISEDSNNAKKSNNAANNRRYKCSQCHKAFTCPYNLEVHSRVHTGERPYKCTTCNKAFTLSHNLDTHKRTHTGETPFACDVCYKTFNQLGHLTTHKRIHNNVRPYECPVCHSTFAHSGALTTHTRTHTGEKPYQCHVCEYKCANAGNLKTHIRTHTGEKPYSCKHCQRAFTRLSSLKKHMRTQHNNED